MEKKICLIVLVVLLLPAVFGFDPLEEQKLEKDKQQIIGQVNSKIELEVQKANTDMQNTVKKEAQDIQDNLLKVVKDSMRQFQIGVFGLMFVTLAIFKILEIKFSTDVLYKKKIKEIDTMKSHLRKEQLKLGNYKRELDKFKVELEGYKHKVQVQVPKWSKYLLFSNILTLCAVVVLVIILVR